MSEPVQRTAHPTTTTKITATTAVSGRHHRDVRPGVKVVADLIPADDLAALYTLPSGRRRPGISGHLNRVKADKIRESQA